MAAVLELLLQEEVAVSAVVRWLRHGPGHRPAEVTRGGSPAGLPALPPSRSALAPAGPGLPPRRPPSSLRHRGPGPCGKVSPPRCRARPLCAAVGGEARARQPGAPVRGPSAAAGSWGRAPSHSRRHRPRRGRALGRAAGRRGWRREGEAGGGELPPGAARREQGRGAAPPAAVWKPLKSAGQGPPAAQRLRAEAAAGRERRRWAGLRGARLWGALRSPAREAWGGGAARCPGCRVPAETGGRGEQLVW